ncbi:Zinc finger CCCH domain-containing protein 32 [Carex littledalei]|uniref:Zinc finger CCCH domain-containing protein 32 n=1 Tax=Carex littledalei TaxID=544730 RepID=A0A833QV79_9POAL|nr:Zinc finger CCCH domain-containing protein 32 [Carex littledalei]
MESGGIRPPAAAAAAAAAVPVQLTAEEEALKRNTDCVYFLASPLTCKKGSECEYRHSEGARINPRDCYYWLNGHCTNQTCAFRHPPLEGLFGAMPTPAALPPATAYNPTKQSTPCYYFLKGNCLKGDRCPFMHGPPSSGTNAVQRQPAKVSAASPIVPSLGSRRKEPSNPSAIAKHNANNTKSTQGNPVSNASKPVLNFNGPNGAAPAITKPRAAVNSSVNNTHQLPNKTSDEDQLSYPHPLSRGTPVQNNDRSDDGPQDSREGDEFLGESSPGFDVIVDHDEEGSRYLPPNEDDFRRAYAEMYPLDDYEMMSRYERDRHGHGVMSEHEYEPEFDPEVDHFVGGYKGNNDQYDRKRRRRDSSSERALDQQPIRRRSQSQREDAAGIIGAETGGINGPDLRNRLMNKQRKLNGSRSRSDVSPDQRDDGHPRSSHHRRDERERHVEERDRYRSRGLDRADLLDRGAAAHGRSRLEGRIKMPLRPPAERSDFMHERHVRGTARVSPVPVDISSKRPHDRMGRRSSDREFVGGRLGSRRDRDEVNFSGPKSLAELRNAKATTDNKVSEGGGVKDSAVDFEGPIPLSEILKRKRGVTGNGSSSENKTHNDGSSPKGGPKTDVEIEEGMISESNDTNDEVQFTSKVDGADELDQEMEEPSNFYEGEEGEEYRMEDENAYQEEGEEEANEFPEGEEEFEDDDEQAFARKVGVVLS